MPQWRIGARYDRLGSNNTGADAEVLAEAGLDNEEHTPQRFSVMLDYFHSEFSQVRLQFNRDESYEQVDNLSGSDSQTRRASYTSRPSLIAKMRRADLLVCSGAGLEAGWLPLLIRRAANSRIQHGKVGYFMAAESVTRLDVPKVLDRSLGDIHAAGNPHVHLDPYRVLEIAILLSHRLQRIDPANSAFYQEKLLSFSQQWKDAIIQWEEKAKGLVGITVVAHHKNWRYLLDWLKMEMLATLEPKPGMPPSTSHLTRLKAKVGKHSVTVGLDWEGADLRHHWPCFLCWASRVSHAHPPGAGGAKARYNFFRFSHRTNSRPRDYVLGWVAGEWEMQIIAVSAAIMGAALLYWCERQWPEVQEAIIGCVFVLAASTGILLISTNAHGGEMLKSLLDGQILWVSYQQLLPTLIVTLGMLIVWFGFSHMRHPIVFYGLFAIAVTSSVQLVGVYLVFASLIMPALAVHKLKKNALLAGLIIGVIAYALGLCISALFDLPSGVIIVWSLAIVGLLSAYLFSRN